MYLLYQNIQTSFYQSTDFRKNHGCHNIPLNFIENINKTIVNGNNLCTVLTDLSHAFSCLPHYLVIAKMYAYCVIDDACKLVPNYFCCCQQTGKINDDQSDWLNPQVPYLSSFGYNVLK